MWSEIIQKIKKLQILDGNCCVFGASDHLYRFNPVLEAAELQRIEARLNCRLPEQLRYFYLEVGNGGAGPDYGILPADELESYRADHPWLGAEHPHYSGNDIGGALTGLVRVVRQHTHESCIVTNGPDCGTIIRYQPGDCVSHEADSLVDLYDRWLDRNIVVFQTMIRLIQQYGDAESETGGIHVVLKHLEQEHRFQAADGLVWVASLIRLRYSREEAVKALQKKTGHESWPLPFEIMYPFNRELRTFRAACDRVNIWRP